MNTEIFLVQITGFTHGCYVPDHLSMIQHNLQRRATVIFHDENYYKTVNCPVFFLIHKDDCKKLNSKPDERLR